MEVKIYGRSTGCPYCNNAKAVCAANKLNMEFIDMVETGMTKDELIEIVGKPVSTVPQIFVDGDYVGGYTEFVAFLRAKNEKKDDSNDQ